MADETPPSRDEQRFNTIQTQFAQGDRERDAIRAEVQHHRELLTGILEWQRNMQGTVSEIRAESKQTNEAIRSQTKDLRALQQEIRKLTDRIHTVDVENRDKLSTHAQHALQRSADKAVDREKTDAMILTKWQLLIIGTVLTSAGAAIAAIITG